MKEQVVKEQSALERLRKLMFLRVVIATFLLGIATFIQIKGTKTVPPESIVSQYFIIVATYVLSFIYLFIVKKVTDFRTNVLIQVTCDVLLITFLVYVTGGIDSVYSVLYPLAIIYSGLYLTRRGSLYIASFSSMLYGILLDLQFYDIIHPIRPSAWDYSFSAGYVLSRIFTHIASFYIVSFLTSVIAEKEERSRALLEEKEREFYQLDLLYKSIIESVNTGIMTIDMRKKIQSFNRAAEEITGLTFTEVEDRPIDEALPGFSDAWRSAQHNRGVREAVYRGELVISGKNNGDKELGFSMAPLKGEKARKIGYIVIFQDLSETKSLEREVERTKRLALIGEIAAGLAHEVRNPLASLSGSIQVLKNSLKLSETDDRLMRIILRGRDQLESLVKNFLLLARPDTGEREAIDVNGLIDHIVESIRYNPDWHEDIEVRIISSDGATVYGNRTEVQELLWNLTLNAAQSMPNGGTLEIETKHGHTDNEQALLEIRISDTGFGIKVENLDKIFIPFYTTKDRGTGLGLAIVSRITESHGGRIDIESEPYKGTVCRLYLPVNELSTVK